MNPVLYIVIPCYNEQEVLPITAPMFLQKLRDLSAAGKIAEESRVLFVNDGSKDKTWEIILDLAASDPHYLGISQSRWGIHLIVAHQLLGSILRRKILTRECLPEQQRAVVE